MSDNEFDHVFKSKFEELDIQPSKDLWAGISKSLNEGNQQQIKRRKFPVVWLAAASVLFFGIGVKLFMPKEETIKLSSSKQIEEESKDVEQLRNLHIKIEKESLHHYDKEANEKRYLEMMAALDNDESLKPKSKTEKVAVAMPKQVKFLAVAESNQDQQISQSTLEKAIDDILAEQEEKNVMMAAIGETTGTESKDKIKNVSDLLNFVISKIDKREEKIVKLSKTEESDMEVTGINLGLFKYNKKY
ncbi:hypothetical protein [Pseudopedobacter beijingensis]|uniref:Anti-sigma factor n=1 Tax=Pseudopedobacter beijingensis TaxID=1207056 RepID=A0ABW4I792_9SPHI